MYKYKLSKIRVVDGDTVEADIELGFGITMRRFIRLLGVNAPEMRGKDRIKGKAAKANMKMLINKSPVVILESAKDATGKYGRVLGVLYSGDTPKKQNLNKMMVSDGFAVNIPRKGKK